MQKKKKLQIFVCEWYAEVTINKLKISVLLKKTITTTNKSSNLSKCKIYISLFNLDYTLKNLKVLKEANENYLR